MNLERVFEGAYVAESMLGAGAFGIVALASGAAVKWIKSTGTVEDKYQAREIEALEACRHPNIVCMIEHEFRAGDLYIVLERWPVSLFTYLRRKRVTLEQAEWMLQNLLCALAHVHARGYLHRDVKPANILLCQDSLCLADFGHAVRSPDVSGTPAQSTNVYTRWYRPPEVALLLPYTSAADLFSAGCVYVEIMRNALGFEAVPLFHESACSYPISGDRIAEGEHLKNMFQILGSPTEADRESLRMPKGLNAQWPDHCRLGAFVDALPHYERVELNFPDAQSARAHVLLSLNPRCRV